MLHVGSISFMVILPDWSLIFNGLPVQAKIEALLAAALSTASNTMFSGDMSWRYDDDGLFPLAVGWRCRQTCSAGM
jgi:hypothetical protein